MKQPHLEKQEETVRKMRKLVGHLYKTIFAWLYSIACRWDLTSESQLCMLKYSIHRHHGAPQESALRAGIWYLGKGLPICSFCCRFQWELSQSITHSDFFPCIPVPYIWSLQAAVVQPPREPLFLQNKERASAGRDHVRAREGESCCPVLLCVHVCLCAAGDVPVKIKRNKRRDYLEDLGFAKMWGKLLSVSEVPSIGSAG